MEGDAPGYAGGGPPTIEVVGKVLRISGRITTDLAAGLLTAGMDLMRRVSVVDLSGVTENDSSLLALLLAWARVAGERRLSILHAAPNLRNLARLYGVEEFLPFLPMPGEKGAQLGISPVTSSVPVDHVLGDPA